MQVDQSEGTKAIGNGPREQTGSVQNHDALRNQRALLAEQLRALETQRREQAQLLIETPMTGARRGIAQRIEALDQRIVALDQQISEVDMAIARLPAAAGTTQLPTPPGSDRLPMSENFILGVILMVVFLLPLSVAITRRIWRRGADAARLSDLVNRFGRVERSVDAIALEVERIGEGQRYLTRLQADQHQPAAARSTSSE